MDKLYTETPDYDRIEAVLNAESAKLDPEIAAYEGMQDILESDYFGKWVVFHGGELAGAFDTDSKAVSEASRRFGRGPYLIRRVGASRCITMPSREVKREKERAKLSIEIAAYERMQDVLETDYFGKWVMIHDEELIGTFDDFNAAANEAIYRFGRGPYLIRRVGASRYVTLPSYAMPPVRRDADR